MNCQICGKSKASRKYNALMVCDPCLKKKEIGEKELVNLEKNKLSGKETENLEGYSDEKIFSYLDASHPKSSSVSTNQSDIREVLPMGKKRKKAAASKKQGASKKPKKKRR